jgi:hypothetical protein
MIELLIFVVVIGVLVWLISLIPLPAPFQQIVLVIGIIVCVIACLQFLFGLNVFGHFQGRYFH